jgi:putative intracellular protease/amidase
VNKKILVILSEWGCWGEEFVGPYDVLTEAGYSLDFATAFGRKPPALPASMDETVVDPPLGVHVTDAHFARRTREIHASDLLNTPINSFCAPPSGQKANIMEVLATSWPPS